MEQGLRHGQAHRLRRRDARDHGAVQVLGGNGYLKEFPAERMMRDHKVLQIDEGSNEIQHLVIARQMTAREPIWPECMPGAPGVDTGQAEPASAVATAR
jgi:Acyl-CoA dehydrogenase, C-terminal domain